MTRIDSSVLFLMASVRALVDCWESMSDEVTPKLHRVGSREPVKGLWDASTETLYQLSPDSVVTIGCAEDCDIVLEETYVSRHHCKVAIEPDGSCWVQDLRSTNGTVVNGILFEGEVMAGKPAPLEVGGFLAVGLTQLDAVGPDARVMLRGRSVTSVLVCAAVKYGSPEKAEGVLTTSASTIRRRRTRQLQKKRMPT